MTLEIELKYELTEQSHAMVNFLFNNFYVVVIFIICCGREDRTSIVLNIQGPRSKVKSGRADN